MGACYSMNLLLLTTSLATLIRDVNREKKQASTDLGDKPMPPAGY